jgi:hypothetical protein
MIIPPLVFPGERHDHFQSGLIKKNEKKPFLLILLILIERKKHLEQILKEIKG